MKKQGWIVVALVIAGIAFYLWRDAREAIQEAEPASELSEKVKPEPEAIGGLNTIADSPTEAAPDPHARDIEAMNVEPGPEYANYSEAELRSLSTSDAEAAVMLARRIEDTAEAEAMYERAVVLSGRPGPLVEWMHLRDQGGLERYNGVLNVDKALLGYEIALIQAKFPYAKQANRDGIAIYEEELKEAGVPLTPAVAAAEQRFARMTEARLAIVGWPWEVQP